MEIVQKYHNTGSKQKDNRIQKMVLLKPFLQYLKRIRRIVESCELKLERMGDKIHYRFGIFVELRGGSKGH